MMVNAAEQRILDDISRIGWHVTCVGPAVDSDDPEEWFAYTVGLSKTFGWPELLCFGLDLDLMGLLLNDAVDECRARDVAPSAGLVLNDVLEGFPARLEMPQPMADHYVNAARWLARHEGLSFSVLQLLWPDKNGCFPDEPGCSPGAIRMQTPLEAK
jgi:hypothetical protein